MRIVISQNIIKQVYTRDGNFLDIKNIFASINGYKTNIGRGGSQKAHILSPMDLRLSFYMMAMFQYNYKLISYLNTFNEISKDRYLSYTNKYFKNNISNTNDNKSLTIDNKYFKNNKSDTFGNKYFKPYRSVIINNHSDNIHDKPLAEKLSISDYLK
jgi:hypothetical protein